MVRFVVVDSTCAVLRIMGKAAVHPICHWRFYIANVDVIGPLRLPKLDRVRLQKVPHPILRHRYFVSAEITYIRLDLGFENFSGYEGPTLSAHSGRNLAAPTAGAEVFRCLLMAEALNGSLHPYLSS